MYKVDSDSALVYSKDDYKTRPVMVAQLLEQLTNDPKCIQPSLSRVKNGKSKKVYKIKYL
jgi:hypothetical protein